MKASKGTWREVLAFACGALMALAVCFALMVAYASDQPREVATPENVFAVEEPAYKPIPAGTYMPLYLQDDVQWSHIEYAGGTIGDSGCGLVCAAMAGKYITTQDGTPLTVAGAGGTACLTDGVNDMEKFAQWIASTYEPYGITHTGKLYSLQSALAKVDAGAVCFAGVRGTFGDSEYRSHVVMIWRHDANGMWWVRDPASAVNSARPWTLEELQTADLFYFVCLAGGFYGTTGH